MLLEDPTIPSARAVGLDAGVPWPIAALAWQCFVNNLSVSLRTLTSSLLFLAPETSPLYQTPCCLSGGSPALSWVFFDSPCCCFFIFPPCNCACSCGAFPWVSVQMSPPQETSPDCPVGSGLIPTLLHPSLSTHCLLAQFPISI